MALCPVFISSEGLAAPNGIDTVGRCIGRRVGCIRNSAAFSCVTMRKGNFVFRPMYLVDS